MLKLVCALNIIWLIIYDPINELPCTLLFIARLMTMVGLFSCILGLKPMMNESYIWHKRPINFQFTIDIYFILSWI